MHLALQWGLLLVISVALLTRLWYEHQWIVLPLLAVTVAVWWPDLRRGARRWWFFYIVGLLIYTLLRALADETGIPTRYQYVIQFDRFIFAGTDPVVWLQSRLFSPSNVDFIDVFATQVHWSYFVLPHAMAIAMYAWRRQIFHHLILRLLAVQYLGLILFFLVPTAPPWLASRADHFGPVYRVMHFVGSSVDPATYWTLYDALGEPNSVAAMPSIHMAVTVILYLWTRRHLPRLQWPFLAYTVLMAVALVHLAEHYVLDLLVGALIAAAVDRVIAARTRQPHIEHARTTEEPTPALVEAR